MEKVEIKVKNGYNFHIPKDVYVQWLKQSLEREIEKENYEKCIEIETKIKQHEQTR